MNMLFFACTDPTGLYQESCFGDTDIEQCLDVLSALVQQDFQLERAYLIQNGQHVELPIEAFDGSPMGYIIKNLQEQWEAILY